MCAGAVSLEAAYFGGGTHLPSEEGLWAIALPILGAMHAVHCAGAALRCVDAKHVLLTDRFTVHICIHISIYAYTYIGLPLTPCVDAKHVLLTDRFTVHICIHISIYAYTYTHTHTHTTHTHTHTHIYIYIYI